MNARCIALLFGACLMTAACSEKPEAERESKSEENEAKPHEDEIAEDCVAFVRSTKVVPPTPECAGCTGDTREALAFQQIKVDRISYAGPACEVTVTLKASFVPGPGGTISGGLAAWISPEQRQAFLSGHAPEGEQLYPVKITYRREGEEWRPVEFDRADAK
ncbi:MAG: hypothetical protein ACJ8NS_09980 [Chthoniobacterales bacterium]